jgi:hypothetical protein
MLENLSDMRINDNVHHFLALTVLGTLISYLVVKVVTVIKFSMNFFKLLFKALDKYVNK